MEIPSADGRETLTMQGKGLSKIFRQRANVYWGKQSPANRGAVFSEGAGVTRPTANHRKLFLPRWCIQTTLD